MVIVKGTPYEVYADERITAKAKGLLAYLISRGGEHVTIERIDDLRDAIDVLEGAFPRVGFFIMRDQIEISFNLI